MNQENRNHSSIPFDDRGVLYIGLVACAGVILVALICGPIRGIPFFWTLIDCSFGVLGAIPLFYCLSLTQKMPNIPSQELHN